MFPMGYLKGTTTGAALFVLPFHFPQLFTLLKEFKTRTSSFNITSFRQRWEEYLRNMPLFYAPFLKSAITRYFGFQIANTPLASEILDHVTGMNYGMQQTLNLLVQEAKIDAERREILRAADLSKQSTAIVNPSGKAEKEDATEVPLSTNVFEIEKDKLISEVNRLRRNIFENDPLFGPLFTQKAFGTGMLLLVAFPIVYLLIFHLR